MELLDIFKRHIASKDGSASKNTVKNYISDIRHFISWFEKTTNTTFHESLVTADSLKLYEKTLGGKIENSVVLPNTQLSSASMKRHLSSLRKFFTYAEQIGKIEKDPFTAVTPEVVDIPTDYWHLDSFRNSLNLSKASKITIKNYISDIQSFAKWYEEAMLPGLENPLTRAGGFYLITQSILEDYRKRLIEIQNAAPRTINRKLSSIRKYLSFAAKEGFIEAKELTIDPVATQEERLPISKDNQIQLTDIQQAIPQPKTYSKIPPVRLVQKLVLFPYLYLEDKSSDIIAGIIAGKPVTGFTKLPRKVTSQLQEKNILRSQSQSINSLLGVKNVQKEFYAPDKMSLLGQPLHKRIIFHARFTRPDWYHKYHNVAFVHYAHLALLVIFASGVGVALYNNLILQKQQPTFAAPTAPPRILSFQGRLTDANDNPITSSTNLRFAIYNDSTASGGALLWQEVNGVIPDQDGIFSIYLGGGTSIPSTVFTDNSSIFLGVSVLSTPELTPRQRIATVGYATNSEFLQGQPPTTQAGITSYKNVILALDSSGNLNLSDSVSTDHTFQVNNGMFKLTGQTLQLATNLNSGGNVSIIPDGLGKIDLQKPLVNNTNNGNIAPGGVEVNDRFGVLATESAVAAFIVNNNTTGGDIFAASSSGTTRFVIANDGTLTSGIYTAQNGVLYGSQTTGIIAQATTSNFGLCLQSGLSNPTWGACGGASYWNQALGALAPYNDTLDLLVGGQTTASAKFRFINNNAGTPVASVSANSGNNATFIAGDGTIGTTNRQTLTIGNSSIYNTTGNLLINPNGVGRIGIFTNTPLVPFDLRGNSGTQAAASISANTTFATLIVDNAGVGDLITASASGVPNFIVRNNGDIVVGQNGAGKITAAVVDPYLVQNQKTTGITSLTFQTMGASNADFIFQNQSTLLSTLTQAGQLQLPITGSAGGLVLGGDTQIFRGSTDRIDVATGDSINVVSGNIMTGGVTRIDSSGNATFNALNITGGCTGCTTGAPSPFQALSGAIVPLNSTLDLLVGGQATASAKFAILNIAGGTPTASISSGLNGSGTYFDANGTIQTTNKKTLTFGGSTTGNIALMPNNGLGSVSVGTTDLSPFYTLLVRNTVGGGAASFESTGANPAILSIDNLAGGNQSVLNFYDASVIKYQVGKSADNSFFLYDNAASHELLYANGGNLAINGFGGKTGIGTPTPDSHLHVTRALSFGATGKALAIFDQVENQDIFTASSSGTPRFTITNTGGITLGGTNGSSTQCLLGGATASWGSCGGSGASPFVYTTSPAGAIAPANSTMDFLIGGQATASAKFAVLNLSGGTPTASISANSGNNAIYIKGDGLIGTTNRQTLTIGNSSTYNTTGDILINPNSVGSVVIGYSSPFSNTQLTVRGQSTLTSSHVYGGYFSPSQEVANSQGLISLVAQPFYNSPAGTLNALFGLVANPTNISTGTVTTAISLYGTVTNNSTGIISNAYGLYIASPSNAGTISNSYALVTEGNAGNVGIGTTTPTSQLFVTRPLTAGTTGKALAIFDQVENQDIFTASSSGLTKFVITNSGNVGIGLATGPTATQRVPTSRLQVYSDLGTLPGASISAQTSSAALLVTNDGVGDILVGSQSGAFAFRFFKDQTDSSHDVTLNLGNAGKLNALDVDPPYTIDGIKYSTYAPSTFLPTEEYTGKATLAYDPQAGAYAYKLDFNNFQYQSDLWVFNRIINPDIGFVKVFMTPNSQARTWYQRDGNKRTITLFADRPSEVSFRLTANRVDFAKYSTVNKNNGPIGLVVPPPPSPIGDSSNDNNINSDHYFNSLTINQKNGQYVLKDANNNNIYQTEAFSKAIIANVKAGLVDAKKIITGTLDASVGYIATLTGNTLSFSQATFSTLTSAASNLGNATASTLAVATDTITIGGQNIRDFIINTVREAGFANSNSISPLAQNEVKTNNISPLSDNKVTVKGNLAVEGNASDSANVALNVNGAASISGTLAAASINTADATISGTLRVNTIEANTIAGLHDKISSIASNLIASNQSNTSTPSSSFSGGNIAINTLNANFGIFEQGITSMGPVTANILTATDTLSVGNNFTISNNAINTVGSDLELQSLRQGTIAFQGGLIKMDTDGNMTIAGNMNIMGEIDAVFGVFSGNLTTNSLATGLISPLGGQDLTIQLKDGPSTPSGKLKIKDNSGHEVLSINSRGDILSSGSASLSKLNFNLVGEAQASSLTEAVATGSAGFATLRAGQPEITIKNPNVTSKSLIYITPFGDTNNKVLYLLRQTPASPDEDGSFTVGISGQSTTSNIQFNWLIVN